MDSESNENSNLNTGKLEGEKSERFNKFRRPRPQFKNRNEAKESGENTGTNSAMDKKADNQPENKSVKNINRPQNPNKERPAVVINENDLSHQLLSRQQPKPASQQGTPKPANAPVSGEKQRNTSEPQRKIGIKSNQRTDGLLVSVVIPLYNEEESLPELSLQLESVLKKVAGHRWEVLFIDDGSTDKSFTVIKTILDRNRNFKVIRFRRNYGKSAALHEGFKYASGKIIITMDADLQDDPEEIPNLIAKLREGYDLVSGWKKKRYDPFIKKITSKVFNFFTSLTSGIKLHDFNCGLKAYKSEVAKSISVYGEMHRYLPALAHWDGFKVGEIPVQHHPRRYGKTKFGISRFFKGYLDLLTVLFTTRYFKRPLHFFGTIGSLLSLSGFVINLYLLVEWITGKTYLSNRPLTLFGVALIIVGVQLISIGLIGEMIVKNSLDKYNVSIKEKIL